MPTQTFTATGVAQTWAWPAGVTSVTAECWGAQGGAGSFLGGKGGYVTGTITKGSESFMKVSVGVYVSANGPAGWNGGGAAGSPSGRGGDASDVRQGGTSLAARVIVAGGGGGGASSGAGGGVGGGLTGGTAGGGGGTQSAGGAAGGGGLPGALGVGGGSTADYMAGGGGGYYGGGSADYGTNSCGGGGSSLVPAGGSTTSGVQSGDGKVVLTWTVSSSQSETNGSTASVTVTASGAGTDSQPFTVAAVVSGSEVLLSWDAQTGATGYAIERDGELLDLDVAGLTYTDTPGLGEHTYRVGVTL